MRTSASDTGCVPERVLTQSISPSSHTRATAPRSLRLRIWFSSSQYSASKSRTESRNNPRSPLASSSTARLRRTRSFRGRSSLNSRLYTRRARSFEKLL